MKDQLTSRWNSFSTREQLILKALGIIILFFLFYAFVWLSVQHGRERLSLVIPEKKAKLILMRSQAADIELLRGKFKSIRNVPEGLKAAIEISAKIHGFTPIFNTTEKITDANRLEISLTQLSFDTWLKWVDSLQSQSHIRAQSCIITPSDSRGFVNVKAVFTTSD